MAQWPFHFFWGGGPQFIGKQQNTPPRKNQIPGATPGIPYNIPKLQVTVGATLEDIDRNMKWYETLQMVWIHEISNRTHWTDP